jgi:hypothetical protein
LPDADVLSQSLGCARGARQELIDLLAQRYCLLGRAVTQQHAELRLDPKPTVEIAWPSHADKTAVALSNRGECKIKFAVSGMRPRLLQLAAESRILPQGATINIRGCRNYMLRTAMAILVFRPMVHSIDDHRLMASPARHENDR